MVAIIMLGCLLTGPGIPLWGQAPGTAPGYRAVISYGDGFLAAGSGGRIDHISTAGEVYRSEQHGETTYNCLLCLGRRIFAGGDGGKILYCPGEGEFQPLESGTREKINALALLGDRVIAGTDGGNILVGDGLSPFREHSILLKGNVVSLSSGNGACYGVTDAGEIIHSEDGEDWEIFDFNQSYAGYYDSCMFTKILVTEKQVVVAGTRKDGSPVLFQSRQGSVWTERSLSYRDAQGVFIQATGFPTDIYYDAAGDQYILLCSEGQLLGLPSCTHCNTMTGLPGGRPESMAGRGHTLLIAGEDFVLRKIEF